MSSIIRTLVPQETLVSAAAPSAVEPKRYLNVGGSWPAFRLDSLEIDPETHALRLVSLPGNAVAVTETLDVVDGLGGLAGIAIDDDGNVYVADAANHAILRIDGCDGQASPLRCLAGPGTEAGELDRPRGLAIGPEGSLYIADSGNDRVQVLELRSQQVRAIIGRQGTAPGEFDDPRAVTVDSAGALYVVDIGNKRVQKFDLSGRVVASFWETVQAQELVPEEPEAIGLLVMLGVQRIVVVDGRIPARLLAYGTDGTLDHDVTAALAVIEGDVTAIAATDDFIYAGDAEGKLQVWQTDGTLVGSVQVFDGLPIAGIAFDCHGNPIVRPLGAAPVLKLEAAAVPIDCGTFLAGPFSAGPEAVRWQRIAMRASVPRGARVQLFSLTSEAFDGASPGGTPPSPADCGGASTALTISGVEPAPLDTWRAAPPAGESFLALNAPARYLWLAGVVRGGDGGAPLIEGIRVEFDHESWLKHLPAVYQRDPAGRDLLERALLLFEDMLDSVGGQIDELPALFDAYAAMDPPGGGSWLDWLAGWVDIELDERWDEQQRRETVARAFKAHGRRGTIESLRELIGMYAGAGVHITEPGRDVSLWALGKVSTLGFDSMLAPAAADGAIVGTTATLGQSHLIREEDFGAPLFERLAHRFCIGVYAVDVSGPEALARVAEVVDREKPAHTVYDLCTIDAAMRVGFQAQIGIDTIVAGPPDDFVTGEGAVLGLGTLLPRLPGQAPLIGQSLTLGKRATLV